MKKNNMKAWFITLILLAGWIIKTIPAAAETSPDDFKVRMNEDSVGLKIANNGKPVVQLQPMIFYEGWKYVHFLTPEDDSPYDGIATFPGNKTVGVKATYEYLKDGVHVHYVLTPFDDIQVLRIQTDLDYEYENWKTNRYQLGNKTGNVPEKRASEHMIAEGDENLLTLGPAKTNGDLSSTVETAPGTHSLLEDDRQWWPKLSDILTHGEKSDHLWTWKKGEDKVFDFTVKFNRALTRVEKNEPKDIDELQSQVDALVKPIVKEKWAPGMVVGLLYKGQTRVFGYGTTDLEKGHVPDGDTVFDVGSITKLFTKLLLSDMVQKGQMKLDDPVQKYVPADVILPTKGGKQITLAQLALHYSGLEFLPKDLDFDNDPDAYSHYSVDHLYRYLSNCEIPTNPGDSYQYSNVGMGLLGIVLSAKNGTTYEEYLKHRILDPLGMTETGIAWTDTEAANAATPYDLDNHKTVKGDWDQRAFDGSVALHTSANDLLKLAQAAMTKTNPVLSGIAFGETAKRLEWGGKSVQHGGDIYGYNSSFYLDRRQKAALVILCNNASVAPASKVAEKIGYLLHGIEADPVDFPKLVELPKAKLKPYVGRYVIDSSDDEAYVGKAYNFTIKSGHLLAQKEGTDTVLSIYQTKKGEFYVRSYGFGIDFLKDAQGRVIGAKPTDSSYFKFLFHKLDVKGQPLVDPAWPKGAPVVETASLRLDDFDKGKVINPLGGSWQVDVDKNQLGTVLKNQKDFVEKDGYASQGSARIYGHFGHFVAPWPFVCLYTNFNHQNLPANLSGYSAIEFWVKGDGKRYRLSVQTTLMEDFCYYDGAFTAPKVWTKVHIELADLVQPSWGKEVFKNFGSVKRILFQPKNMSDEDFDLSISDVTLVQ